MITVWKKGHNWYAQTHMIRCAAPTAAQAAFDAGVGSGLIKLIQNTIPVELRVDRMTSLEAQMLAVMDAMTADKETVELSLLNAELDGLKMIWNQEFPEWEPDLTHILPLAEGSKDAEPIRV